MTGDPNWAGRPVKAKGASARTHRAGEEAPSQRSTVVPLGRPSTRATEARPGAGTPSQRSTALPLGQRRNRTTAGNTTAGDRPTKKDGRGYRRTDCHRRKGDHEVFCGVKDRASHRQARAPRGRIAGGLYSAVPGRSWLKSEVPQSHATLRSGAFTLRSGSPTATENGSLRSTRIPNRPPVPGPPSPVGPAILNFAFLNSKLNVGVFLVYHPAVT